MQRKWHGVLVEETRDSCTTEGASRMGDENVMAEAIPVRTYYRPWGFQEVEAPSFWGKVWMW